jgi:hypothetical protein
MSLRRSGMPSPRPKGAKRLTRRPTWQIVIGALIALALVPLAAWAQAPHSHSKARASAAAETIVTPQPTTTWGSTHGPSTRAARSEARAHTAKRTWKGTKTQRAVASPVVKPAASSTTTRAVAASTPATAVPAVTASSARAHFTVNLKGSYSAARAAGFNVFDVAGSQNNPAGVKTKLNALPAGSKAMIWVGNLDNSSSTPGFTLAQFKAQVNALKSDPRVYGYFIADEPHPGKFPLAAAHVRERADYLRATAPAQKSFIVVLDGTSACGGTLGCEYAALAPSKTHVDLVGIDSYPCHLGAACDYSKITQRVNVAAKMGIPKSQMVPVYQAFGQEGKASGAYYRTPTASELSKMLSTWTAALPNAVLDYAYTWGTQTTAPQALVNHPALVSVVKGYNGR